MGIHSLTKFQNFCEFYSSFIYFVCRLRADCSPLSAGILYGRLHRVTIPESVIIKFVFLRMSKVLLETC